MATVNKNISQFLAGGGEMGDRIRRFNWKQNPLGDPEFWPASLKTCVRIMLSSQQPIWIGWGKALIKLYNDPYIDIVRGKHPQSLGQPASVVWKDIWKDIEPLLSKAMQHDEGSYQESQLLIMHRSGFPEETYYTFSYTPVLGDDGKPEGIICYNTADTEKIYNERALKTLQRLDTLAQKRTEQEVYDQAAKALAKNNLDIPFALIYKIINNAVNARLVASCGITAQHSEISELIDLKKPGIRSSNISRAVREQMVLLSQNNGRWKNLPTGGWTIMPQQFVHVPILSVNKKLTLAVLTIGLSPHRKFDDTYRAFIQSIADQLSQGVNSALAYDEEYKRAKALEEIDKAKTQFFTNISHEFRTPITLILGPLEALLKEDAGLSQAQKQNIELTYRNALRLLKLVNNLLDFSRIESGRLSGNYVKTDVATYTSNLASSFRSIIETAGMTLTVEAGKITEPVFIDPQMWEKIVFNLLSNAFKYTLKGTITVRIFSKQKDLVLEVEDTGIGIPETELPKMFERFHRVEQTTGRSYEGTGIGLSLIKELVELHGGAIKVESREGAGSRFTVLIPLGKAHLAATQVSEVPVNANGYTKTTIHEEETSLVASDNGLKKPATTQEKPPVEKSLVLIVDDNADMRRHINAVVSTHYNTLMAANGRDALEILTKHTPALILSDIMMPVMDGISLLKKVREQTATTQIPVILITARAGEESRLEGFEIGADDYLVKPFSANELLSRIKAQIRIAGIRFEITRRLQGFLVHMPAAVALLEGPEFTLSIANKKFVHWFGQDEKNSSGATLTEAFPKIAAEGLLALVQRASHSGEPVEQNEMLLTCGKEQKFRQGYFDIVIYPVSAQTGKPVELIIHAVESTQQVLTRKMIEASEKKFRTLAETMPQLVCMTDDEGNLLFSSANWHGYAGIQPLKLQDIDAIIHEEDRQDNQTAWQKSMATGGTYKTELRLLGNNGFRWYHAQGEPIRDKEGAIIHWIIAFSDINDQKSFSDQLESLIVERTRELMAKNRELERTLEKEKELTLRDQKKSDFILMASHELKTPITTILGYVQLLIAKIAQQQDTAPEMPMLQTALKAVEKQVKNLTGLITHMLDLSKIENGQLELNKTEFNFAEFIRETVQQVQYIYKNSIELYLECDCVVYMDRERMAQVLINLIANAVKYSPDLTKVEVRVFKLDDAHVCFSVRDFGIGMEPAELKKIFDRFYRVDSSRQKGYPGFGIGLFIAKDIVSKHQGTIEVSSEKNVGSEFTVTIPLQ